MVVKSRTLLSNKSSFLGHHPKPQEHEHDQFLLVISSHLLTNIHQPTWLS